MIIISELLEVTRTFLKIYSNVIVLTKACKIMISTSDGILLNQGNRSYNSFMKCYGTTALLDILLVVIHAVCVALVLLAGEGTVSVVVKASTLAEISADMTVSVVLTDTIVINLVIS